MEFRRIGWVLCLNLIYGSAIASAQQPGAPPAFTEGQKIEVREGDTWSAATVLKHEGRRYLIHYEGADGAADEWVTVDRMRLPGAATTAPAPNAAAPKPPPKPVFAVGQKVEVKWGGSWWTGTITAKRGDWFLVTYERGSSREWIEPWRLRKLGSTEDNLPHVQPNPTVMRNEGPPRDKPGDPPEPRGRARRDEQAKASEDTSAPATPADRSEMTLILPEGAPTPIAPDAEPSRSLAPKGYLFRGPTSDAFRSRKRLIFAAGAKPLAVLGYSDDRGASRGENRVERIDLLAGSSTLISLPLEVVTCDISPEGTHLLSHSAGFGFGAESRLDLWQLDGTAAKHVISFRPHDDRDAAWSDVEWARFVNGERVATADSNGRVIVWDVRKAKALYSINGANNATPAVSAGGKYLAVGLPNGVAIVETANGKLMRLIDGTSMAGAMLSFSPDGRQLAGIADGSLTIWNLSDGAVAHEMGLGPARSESIDWVDDGCLLINGSDLVAPGKMLTAWRYQPGDGQALTGASYNGRFYYVAPGGGRDAKPVLTSVDLPAPEARAALPKLSPELLLLRAGSKVSLEVNAGELQDVVRDAMTRNLTAAGYVVAEGQPIRVIAEAVPGEVKSVEFRTFGRRPFEPNTKVEMQVTKMSVTIVDPDGQTVWERKTTTSPPGMVTTREGQSIEDAVHEAAKPKPGFFQNLRVPRSVPKLSAARGLGESKLGAQGVIPAR